MTSQQISPMCEDITGFSLSGCQTMEFSSCHHCDCCSLRSTLKCPYLSLGAKYFANAWKEWCLPRKLTAQGPSSAKRILLCAHTHLCSWWGGGHLGENYNHTLKSMANFGALLNQSLLQDKKKEQERESEKPCG